jgi:hypothetical protein
MIVKRTFIGGPLDGKLIAVESETRTFTAAAAIDFNLFIDHGATDDDTEAIAVQTHLYIRMSLVDDIVVMAHSSLSIEGVAAILVHGYKP